MYNPITWPVNSSVVNTMHSIYFHGKLHTELYIHDKIYGTAINMN